MKTLVVYCHPVAGSFTSVVRDAALQGLADGGHEVRLHDLHADGFDPVLSASEHSLHLDSAVPADVQRYADDLVWCESLVLVYPTWWSGQPAMLKGWVDRVWVNGVAWTLPSGANRLRPLLGNIRLITVVTSHGSSKLVNSLEGESGKRIANRSLRILCNRRCRTRWIAIYGIDTSSQQDRVAFLHRVRRRLAK